MSVGAGIGVKKPSAGGFVVDFYSGVDTFPVGPPYYYLDYGERIARLTFNNNFYRGLSQAYKDLLPLTTISDMLVPGFVAGPSIVDEAFDPDHGILGFSVGNGDNQCLHIDYYLSNNTSALRIAYPTRLASITMNYRFWQQLSLFGSAFGFTSFDLLTLQSNDPGVIVVDGII